MKYIYNVTYHIAPEVSAQWQAWIGEHMPQWLEQSQFSQVKLLKIHIDHPDSEAFSLQYETEDSSVVLQELAEVKREEWKAKRNWCSVLNNNMLWWLLFFVFTLVADY